MNFEKRIYDIFKNTNNLKFEKFKSKHWKKFYNKDLFNPETNLINFRNIGGASKGLDQHNSFEETLELFLELQKKIGKEFVENNLDKLNIGNSPKNFKHKNFFIDYHNLIFIYWLYLVKENTLIDFNSVCEIGGGFGAFSKLFINNYKCKILLIDLPEANLLSAYYLHKNFPEKKFFLYDNYLKKEYLSLENFEENDILILPPNCKIDKKIKFDLFINSRSFQEMKFDLIKKYFNFIEKHIQSNGYFLNINRFEKTSVGYPIYFHEYPYSNKWKKILSQTSFKQEDHIFLLCKYGSEEKNNISIELKKIKKKHQNNFTQYKIRTKIKNFILKYFLKM